MVGPHSEGWLFQNANFYHFTGGNAALGSCTHCIRPGGDNGARTYHSQKLHFDDATVTKRVTYLAPGKEIWHDFDGTLTGLGRFSYATPAFTHNRWSGCTEDQNLYSGLICTSSQPVRRLVFHTGDEQIDTKTLYLWRYDDDIIADMTDDEIDQYLQIENASQIDWVKDFNPMRHWTVPVVTGHKYYMRWEYGLDFEYYSLDIVPWLWDNSESITIVMPHYDRREAINFETNNGG